MTHSAQLQGFNRQTHTHTRTSVLQVWGVAHKQHVGVRRVCDPDEARLVLQWRSHTHAGLMLRVRDAVIVGTAQTRPWHHLTDGQTGVLQRGWNQSLTHVCKWVVVCLLCWWCLMFFEEPKVLRWLSPTNLEVKNSSSQTVLLSVQCSFHVVCLKSYGFIWQNLEDCVCVCVTSLPPPLWSGL